MTSTLEGLLRGFEVALTPENLGFVLLGAFVGMVIGMLPGLGPVTAIGVMIPIIYTMNPVSALIMMAGIYYGSMFGGAISSILLNAPGVSGTVAASFDGYPMARQGKAGKALTVAAIADFVGATVGAILLALVAPIVASFAVKFGPVEIFALMFFTLTLLSGLSGGSTVRALIAVVLGLMLSTVGIDQQTGTQRFMFGIPNLSEGINFLIIVLGLFAVAEVFYLLMRRDDSSFDGRAISSLRITRDEAKAMSGPIARQSILGFFIGVLPGAGGTISSMVGYFTEKRIARDPSTFGKGNIKGLAAPQAANNSADHGAFVPLLTLGIPGSETTAVMLGALLALNIKPGPLLIQDNPDLFWGTIASMYIGSVILLILALPLIKVISRILLIPKPMLSALILVFSFVGIYGINFDTFSLFLLVIFGALGFLFRQLRFPVAPFILAFILGNLMEQSFRQALTIANGSFAVFFTSPVSLALIVLAVVSLAFPYAQKLYRRRST